MTASTLAVPAPKSVLLPLALVLPVILALQTGAVWALTGGGDGLLSMVAGLRARLSASVPALNAAQPEPGTTPAAVTDAPRPRPPASAAIVKAADPVRPASAPQPVVARPASALATSAIEAGTPRPASAVALLVSVVNADEPAALRTAAVPDHAPHVHAATLTPDAPALAALPPAANAVPFPAEPKPAASIEAAAGAAPLPVGNATLPLSNSARPSQLAAVVSSAVGAEPAIVLVADLVAGPTASAGGMKAGPAPAAASATVAPAPTLPAGRAAGAAVAGVVPLVASAAEARTAQSVAVAPAGTPAAVTEAPAPEAQAAAAVVAAPAAMPAAVAESGPAPAAAASGPFAGVYGEDWVRAQAPRQYTLLLRTDPSLDVLERWVQARRFELPLAVVATRIDGRPVFALLGGSFPHSTPAAAVAKALAQHSGLRPWVKRFEDLPGFRTRG